MSLKELMKKTKLIPARDDEEEEKETLPKPTKPANNIFSKNGKLNPNKSASGKIKGLDKKHKQTPSKVQEQVGSLYEGSNYGT
mmetsp:Transcript_11452/g.17246  ORF Transcript_11452/g.17246 Transcript_11452/m.17246 type:complete len:83 (+) Transcript_11452:368-616(+)